MIDEGSGFIRQPFAMPPDGVHGGYGMLIIHKLTNEVHLLNGGRRVRLVKRLSTAPAIPYCVS